MTYLIAGSLGFLMFFLYDINSLAWKNRILKKFFFGGCVLLCFSTIGIIWTSRKYLKENIYENMGWLALTIIFMGMLIYTLFFALPFDKTYVQSHEHMEVYNKGIYALCRHPGVLWFTGMYISLCFLIEGQLMIMSAIVFCSLNFLYIVFQDNWVFPKIFNGYEEYIAETPFLIPNVSSICKCIDAVKHK